MEEFVPKMILKGYLGISKSEQSTGAPAGKGKKTHAFEITTLQSPGEKQRPVALRFTFLHSA